VLYNVISLQPLLCLIRDEKNEIIHVLPEQGREQGSTPPRDGEEFLQDLTLIGGELTRDILNIYPIGGEVVRPAKWVRNRSSTIP
jgi:hypothetical protein